MLLLPVPWSVVAKPCESLQLSSLVALRTEKELDAFPRNQRFINIPKVCTAQVIWLHLSHLATLKIFKKRSFSLDLSIFSGRTLTPSQGQHIPCFHGSHVNKTFHLSPLSGLGSLTGWKLQISRTQWDQSLEAPLCMLPS